MGGQGKIKFWSIKKQIIGRVQWISFSSLSVYLEMKWESPLMYETDQVSKLYWKYQSAFPPCFEVFMYF